MRRLVLLTIISVIVIVSCSSGQQSLGQPVVTPAPSPTPHLTATALAKQAPLLATLMAQDDFKWNVSIVQDNEVITAQQGEFYLQRKPFTFRIEVSKPVEVYLNALETDENFKRIQAGLTTDDRCIQVHPFCSLDGMATVTSFGELIVNREDPEVGNQAFALDPRLDELGSQFTVTGSSVVFERYISQITLYTQYLKTDTGTKRIFTEVPVDQFAGDKLYLVFLAKHLSDKIIGEDELQKFILTFQ